MVRACRPLNLHRFSSMCNEMQWQNKFKTQSTANASSIAKSAERRGARVSNCWKIVLVQRSMHVIMGMFEFIERNSNEVIEFLYVLIDILVEVILENVCAMNVDVQLFNLIL